MTEKKGKGKDGEIEEEVRKKECTKDLCLAFFALNLVNYLFTF